MMPATKKPRVPSYRLHKPSGLAVVRLNGTDVYLGKHGSPESHAEYQRVIGEWLTNHRQTPRHRALGRQSRDGDLTINELFVAYWRFAERYYLKHGQPTSTQQHIRDAIKPLVDLYGYTAVRDFGPLALKALRQTLIEKHGWSRPTINKAVGIIKRLFKWGVENELVPPAVHQGLQAVSGLRRGRCEAPEPAPVRPVSEAHVEATLPHMPEPLAAMAQLQLLTGMRPGEVTIMRTGDLDTSGEVWIYRPGSHKTEHHGRTREIYFGPKAQKVLRPWLRTELDAYRFSPAQAEQRRRERCHAQRRTPLSCGNKPGTNRRPRRRKKPADRYTTQSCGRAIDNACDKAFPPPPELTRRRVPARGRKARATRWESSTEWRHRLGEKKWAELQRWRREHRWSPNQLRHSAATFLRKQFGLDAARVILGHSAPAVTEIYAELDHAKAAQIMGEVG